MEQLHFSTDISAGKEKVWNVLWDDSTYPKWTIVFGEGCYAESDWEEDSKILFLSAGGNGMVSVIVRKILNECMSFQHLGMVKDGKELPPTDDINSWQGATENYTLTETNGVTHLEVTMDVTPDMEKYFNEKFPKALALVKELAEK